MFLISSQCIWTYSLINLFYFYPFMNTMEVALLATVTGHIWWFYDHSNYLTSPEAMYINVSIINKLSSYFILSRSHTNHITIQSPALPDTSFRTRIPQLLTQLTLHIIQILLRFFNPITNRIHNIRIFKRIQPSLIFFKLFRCCIL